MNMTNSDLVIGCIFIRKNKEFIKQLKAQNTKTLYCTFVRSGYVGLNVYVYVDIPYYGMKFHDIMT